MTFKELKNKLQNEKPLIHAITNPISINQCANLALSVGALPIMAEHPKEAAEITQTAKALILNLGNITDARMESMTISSQVGNKNNIPVVLDAVGVACSSLRRDFANKLIKSTHFSLIKGNYSEIYALDNSDYKSSGVDADIFLNTQSIQKSAIRLARKLNTIILASGKEDIITDGKRIFLIKNGHPRLSSVTGTGCMLGMMCTVFLSVCTDIEAVCMAAAMMGICGEIASQFDGNGSFMTGLLDSISLLTDTDFEKKIRMEEIKIEDI